MKQLTKSLYLLPLSGCLVISFGMVTNKKFARIEKEDRESEQESENETKEAAARHDGEVEVDGAR